ncbi:MAG: YibE/F family protein [Acidimicrobiia bacterium]|nr:YibE/F family protein [Acidimicrobiia bacterium]
MPGPAEHGGAGEYHVTVLSTEHAQQGHSHQMEGGWDEWMDNPVLRALLALLLVAALVTLVALAALWPDGSGRAAVQAEAATIGLAAERLEATVAEVIDGECAFSSEGNVWDCRTVVVTPSTGPDAGALLALPEFVEGSGVPVPEVSVGDAVVIDYEPTTGFYSYGDQDRRSALVWLFAVFAVVVIALGRLRGLLALIAMATTVAILVGFVAPSVLDGNDPVAVSVVAASVIAFVSLYLTHGFNPTTTIALIGTLLALLLTLVLSSVFFDLARFTGLATEEGVLLPVLAQDINMASLLLGGAIIGALGALDDVTVTQVATVAELKAQNPGLSRRRLISSGIRVGREHIAATVNTLLLAYAGVSMPLLLLFVVSDLSLAMIANSEIVAVEIVRTLCGSLGLIAAVPITTWLTAVLVSAGAPAEHGHDDDLGPAEEPAPAPEPERIQVSWDDFAPRDD